MRRSEPSTLNIEHSTPKDCGMAVWEFNEGEGTN
jgi:hypothetical protein